MIIVMRQGSSSKEVGDVIKRVQDLGYQVHLSKGVERTIIGIIGDERPLTVQPLERLSGVEAVVPILKPFKLASRDFHPENSVITIKGTEIGTDEIIVMAGPCSVESWEQLQETAHVVKRAGAKVLRGGAFKPRTSPYSFQGLGEEGLQMLRAAGDETGLLIVTEVMAPKQVDLVCHYADILQIGARNMQNYNLLRAAGDSGHPVLLKRGFSSTVEELLMAAEYILSKGDYQVMLCERGIRTFDTKYTRNTLDINAVPVLKQLSHLPVIVDPSHATGKWDLVTAAARAGVAAGADGLLIEVHPEPDKALSDGQQSLRPENFVELMAQIRRVAEAVDRTVTEPEVERVAVSAL
ncbi:MAG: Phospho-2-dehydro-3-deoxyheptonate aldolase [Anaerolineales bacterium]|nr:Phospho-2-dehydro-3-deoxyheptonate aldolase [Anaerolineales bacterium]